MDNRPHNLEGPYLAVLENSHLGFMPIPRVASTSIKHAIKKHSNVGRYSSRLDQVCVFGVVHNPHDRLVSVSQRFCKDMYGEHLLKEEALEKAGLVYDMPWLTFLANMRHSSWMDKHTASQAWWWKDIRPDHMVTLEDLDSSWKELQEFYPELGDLPEEHLKKTAHGLREEYFDKAQIVRFSLQLEDDIEIYQAAERSEVTLAEAYKAWRLKNLR